VTELSRPQADLLKQIVTCGSVSLGDLAAEQGAEGTDAAAELEAQGLVDIVLGTATPTDEGEKFVHDSKPVRQICSLCAGSHSTQDCVAGLEPVTKLARRPKKKRRKREHRCITCKKPHDSLAEANACQDTHW
jgi:hypothetical protein